MFYLVTLHNILVHYSYPQKSIDKHVC